MNILVFGAGAIGRYLGGHLAEAGHHVNLITRSGSQRLQREGLTIKKKRGGIHVQPVASPSLRQALQFADEKGIVYDFVLMTMKSYDVPGAVDELVAFTDAVPPLITLQNGINAEMPIVNQFGQGHVIPGSITVPVSYDTNFNVVEEKQNRGIALSTFTPRDLALTKQGISLFKKAGLKTELVKNHESLKWSKAIINMMGNATSAILNRQPHVVYQSTAMYKLEMRMIRETFRVMDRLQIEPINLPGAQALRLRRVTSRLSDRWLQPLLTNRIKSGRGNKMPSFQIDLAAGKEQNEVLFHNGAVARIGKELAVPTPINAALNDILIEVATQGFDWDRFDGQPKALLTTVNRYIRAARVSGQWTLNRKKGVIESGESQAEIGEIGDEE